MISMKYVLFSYCRVHFHFAQVLRLQTEVEALKKAEKDIHLCSICQLLNFEPCAYVSGLPYLHHFADREQLSLSEAIFLAIVAFARPSLVSPSHVPICHINAI